MSSKYRENYRNRAEERRQGTSDETLSKDTQEMEDLVEGEKINRLLGKAPPKPTSMNTPLPETNKGLQMLKKMGWNDQKGIGKNEQGMTAPISFKIKPKGTGLGFNN